MSTIEIKGESERQSGLEQPSFFKRFSAQIILDTKFRPRKNILHTILSVTSFLPRDALVHSAVLRLHVVRPSVCNVGGTVDQNHIGWKSWKLIARTLSPTPSLFVAQRPSTYSQGNMGKFGGD